MTFKVGQYVVYAREMPEGVLDCIRRWFHPYPGDDITIGTIYRVSAVLDCGSIIQLCGVYAPPDEYWEEGWLAACFDPLVKGENEISFTDGADPSSEGLDNRRRVHVRT